MAARLLAFDRGFHLVVVLVLVRFEQLNGFKTLHKLLDILLQAAGERELLGRNETPLFLRKCLVGGMPVVLHQLDEDLLEVPRNAPVAVVS